MNLRNIPSSIDQMDFSNDVGTVRVSVPIKDSLIEVAKVKNQHGWSLHDVYTNLVTYKNMKVVNIF